MGRRLFSVSFYFILIALTGLMACAKKEEAKPLPTETPEQVVEKFYMYIAEGGLKTTEEAYKLVSTKRSVLPEGKFKDIIRQYPVGMKVKVKGSKIENDKAMVFIDCDLPSKFGSCITESQINLEIDPKVNAWRIDFSGDTYDELEQIKKDTAQNQPAASPQAGDQGHEDHKGHEGHETKK
ncbi:MAG: hypothetical protein OEV28_12735 [Nitrospirota bacterium]|nr:hypothetical protein [Nitrospirota bacterium]